MSENRLKSFPNLRFAGLGPRFWALVIDFLFLSLIFFPITQLVKGVWIMTPADHAWSYGWFITDPLCLIFLIAIFVYFVYTEGTYGATLGKKILGLHVIGVNATACGLKRAFVRNMLRIVDALPVLNILGVVLILNSPEKARFGDRVAGTRVVSIPREIIKRDD